MPIVPSISATDLFTPAASGLGSNGAVPSLPAPGTWLSNELTVAAMIGLPTTAWQSGGVEREILALEAVMFAQTDAFLSVFAQSAFLSTAASGTVTYQALNGQTITVPVTPDPSIPSQNATGALGWLDNTCQNVYGVKRILATFAAGQLAIVNLGTQTQGPYIAGTYHAANVNGSTYSNLSTFSVPSSAIAGTGGNISFISPSIASTTVTTQGAHGLSSGSYVYLAVPTTSGVLGLNGVFALVGSVLSPTSFVANVGSTGSFSILPTPPKVYACSVANMQADKVGTGSNASPGAVTTAITQAPGILVSNVTAWSAANYESNGNYATRTKLSLAAVSPNGPAQAYTYIALSSSSLLSSSNQIPLPPQIHPYTFTNGAIVAANTYATPATGIISVVVASSTPATTTLGSAVTPGCAQLAVTGATVGAGIVTISSASPHNLGLGGGSVVISGLLGIPAANGSFFASYVSANQFSITVTATGSYTSGGVVEGGDLGAVDNLIQAMCVPDGIVGASAISALSLPIAVVATVTVPQAFVALFQAAAPIGLQNFLSSLPLGGVFSSTNVVPVSYLEVVAAIIDAGVLVLNAASYVIGTPVVTVNGGTVDVPFPTPNYQAVQASFALTVIGV